MDYEIVIHHLDFDETDEIKVNLEKDGIVPQFKYLYSEDSNAIVVFAGNGKDCKPLEALLERLSESTLNLLKDMDLKISLFVSFKSNESGAHNAYLPIQILTLLGAKGISMFICAPYSED